MEKIWVMSKKSDSIVHIYNDEGLYEGTKHV